MPETSLPYPSITEMMLLPVLEGIIANITVVMPILLGLFSIFLGIRIIPAVISRLFHT